MDKIVKKGEKMNKIYVSDLIFYKKTKEEIIKILKENKIKNLELFIEPLDKEYTEKMGYVLDNYTLESLSFHGPFRRCNLAVITDESWKNTIESYQKSFKIAKNYKPNFMVLHSNEWIPNNKITKELKENILNKIDYLVKLGKEYEIDVVIENVGIKRNMVFSQKEYEDIILEKNYKSLIDIGHAYLNEWNIETLIKRLSKNILGYHFHNNDGNSDQHRPITKGKIDYKQILEWVKKYTPDAEIVLEYDFTENEEEVIKDLKLLEKELEKLNK